MEERKKKSIAGKLAAYSLAAGAAAFASQAVTSDAAMVNYVGPWYDTGPGPHSDLILFKMDGTVLVDDSQIDLYPTRDDTLCFEHYDSFWWYGSDEKNALTLHAGPGTGFVGGFYTGDPNLDRWDVGRLGGDYVVGSSLADGRAWADGDFTGGLGGWYFYFHGEWPFGGGGYIGLYFDDTDGRHYGWANVGAGAYSDVTLHEYAYSTTPGMAVLTGGGELIPEPLTLSLLAVGAAGLAARRRKRA